MAKRHRRKTFCVCSSGRGFFVVCLACLFDLRDSVIICDKKARTGEGVGEGGSPKRRDSLPTPLSCDRNQVSGKGDGLFLYSVVYSE